MSRALFRPDLVAELRTEVERLQAAWRRLVKIEHEAAGAVELKLTAIAHDEMIQVIPPEKFVAFVRDYIETTPRPAQDGCVRAWHKSGHIGDRPRVRAEFTRQTGGKKPGRPRR
jgi:hypothetical protein